MLAALLVSVALVSAKDIVPPPPFAPGVWRHSKAEDPTLTFAVDLRGADWLTVLPPAKMDDDLKQDGLRRRQRALFEKKKQPVAVFDWAKALKPAVPLNKLEAKLMEMQELSAEPDQEFQAFVLRRGDDFRVYFFQRAKDGSWPQADELRGQAKADIEKSRFRFYAHLHNHPFELGNRHGDSAGTLLPSHPDGELYRQLTPLKLERAWIVNGLESQEIPAFEFGAIP